MLSLRSYRRFLAPVALGWAIAQTSAQVIRTETQVVLVDVVASDKKGNYIRDLAASEFRVWEDGKEQKITSVTREIAGDARQTAAALSAAPVPPARKRYVVVLFDNASMTTREQAWSRQTAMQWIDTTAAASASGNAPFTAVMSFGGALRVAQTFTEDIARAKQAIATMPATASAISDDAVVNRLTTEFSNRDNIKALESLVRNLESVPGRKSLVWFTPGFPLSSEYSAAVDAVINSANRSNLAIYPVSMRQLPMQGVTVTADQSGASTQAVRGRVQITSTSAMRGTPTDVSAIDTPATQMNNGAMLAGLSRLAEKTGGFVIEQPEDTSGLKRVAAEQNEYYLLGYTPPSSSPGTCHKLRVEVTRKNVELRSRAEYCNRPAGDVLSGNAAERVLEARALEQNAPPASLPVKATAPAPISATMQATYFYTGPNVARVVAVLELDPSNISFKKDKGMFQASLDILGLAQKGDTTGARFSDIVKLDFAAQAEVDAFKQKTYRYEAQFDIAAGDYTLTVAFGASVATSGTGASFGKLSTPLSIKPYQVGDFTLSSLALSHQFRAANQADSALDELLIDDRKKLVADGVEIIPAGSAKLSATGQAGVFVEIYEPLLASPETQASTIVAIQLRVLDRTSGVQKVDTGLVRVNLANLPGNSSVIPLGLSIPLRTLAVGGYTLEVQAVDSINRTARRTVDFEIE